MTDTPSLDEPNEWSLCPKCNVAWHFHKMVDDGYDNWEFHHPDPVIDAEADRLLKG